MINGNCFALAGMHLISKLLDKWIWATFEPQNNTTNPNRCVVLGLHRQRSAPHRRWSTDRAANSQTDNHEAEDIDDGGQPGAGMVQLPARRGADRLLLAGLSGNSIIEGENVGMPLSQASCISCHAVSSIKNNGTDGITLLTTNPVGAPKPLPSNAWIRRDFVWSMFLACPGGAQNCAK